MPRFAQLVLGPAGSGKSTYVSTMISHGQVINRPIRAVNLDPAAEEFRYQDSIIADIRELIHIDDVMEDDELRFGPNGGLVFCMEHLIENPDWLQEQLGEDQDDYILFDCPGQIELSTHLGVMRGLIELLQNLDFRVCAVFLLDSQFITDTTKFFSGLMVSLATMINLEVPFVNLLTKTDLLDRQAKTELDKFLEPDSFLLQDDGHDSSSIDRWGQKYHKLTRAIATLIDDYSLIKFLPINIFNENSVRDVLLNIDMAIQFGEDQDVKVRDFDDEPGLGVDLTRDNACEG